MYISLASQLQRRCGAPQSMARSPCAPSQNQPHALKAEIGDNFGQQRRVILSQYFHYDGIFDNSKAHCIFGTYSKFRCQKVRYDKVIVG
jgi:hypothetical protein